MKKKGQNKKQAGKGYSYSGIPAWLVKTQSDAVRELGVTKKTRQRAFFIPIWNDKYRVKGVPKKYQNIDAITLENACAYISKRMTKLSGLPKLVFTPLPNNRTLIKVYEIGTRQHIPFAGMTFGSDNKIKEIHFLNKITGLIQFDVNATRQLYEIYAYDLNSGVPIIIFSETNRLEPGKEYFVDTFVWYKTMLDAERLVCVERPIHYLFNYNRKKTDYTMFSENISKINGWDDISFQWGYDNEIMGLIMSSIMYFEKNAHALNSVVFGGTQIGKSSIFRVLEKIFGDVSIAGTKSTVKGLTGSHWESGVKGALMSCKYVAPIDEIFRLGKQDATSTPNSEMISALLNSLTEVLEHGDKQAPSGKGTQRLYFDKSMLGMNNIMDFNIFEKSWKADPAPYNRISLLLLGEDIKDKMTELSKTEPIPSSMFAQRYEDRLLQKNLNIATIRQMFLYARNIALKKVKFDMDKHSPYVSYMNQSAYVHEDFYKPAKFFALVKCAAVWNWIFNSSKLLRPNQKIHPSNVDFMQAVRWMDMIGRSFKQIMGLP